MFNVAWYDQTYILTGMPLGVLALLGGAFGIFLIVENLNLFGSAEQRLGPKPAVRKRRKKK